MRSMVSQVVSQLVVAQSFENLSRRRRLSLSGPRGRYLISDVYEVAASFLFFRALIQKSLIEIPGHEILQFTLRRRGLDRPEPLLLARSGCALFLASALPVSATLLGRNVGANKGSIEERATTVVPTWKSTGPEAGPGYRLLCQAVKSHREIGYLRIEASPFAPEQGDAEMQHAQARRHII